VRAPVAHLGESLRSGLGRRYLETVMAQGH
jgi:hypothetical protein